MTASTMMLILTSEVSGQRVELGNPEIVVIDKPDVSIHQGMQGMGKHDMVVIALAFTIKAVIWPAIC